MEPEHTEPAAAVQPPAEVVTDQSAIPAQQIMNPNTKIVEEFQYLLEKSQQLFAGLRDLPPTGKNWQPYFQRTFEVYTKLWKFQQTHRLLRGPNPDSAVLESKELYGLKRYEIGEIASKIGQLYYHYYLRTSETNYLYESFVFYEAIRERQYFRDVLEAKNPPLMIKKLRYHARFIVVCLLLNASETMKKLLDELTTLVDEYTRAFKPTDANEWAVVVAEISAFLEAERRVSPPDNATIPASSLVSRLPLLKPATSASDATTKLKLQEAILVGNYASQIKFSELTIDMFRILQIIEREPSVGASGGGSDAMVVDSGDGPGAAVAVAKRTNPHKYLLYRPTLAQLLLYIATAYKDMNENTAMFLYISADGSKCPGDAVGYTGGVSTAVNVNRRAVQDGAPDDTNLVHSLHPGDLVPFMRKPLFVVVDSTNSVAFKLIVPNVEYAAYTAQVGSLLTLFLHNPLKAFAYVNEISFDQAEVWAKCQIVLTSLEKLVGDALEASETLDKSFKRFMQDDFLRQIIVRYALCCGILYSHVGFKEAKFLPSSQPTLASKQYMTGEVVTKMQELVATANRAQNYAISEDVVAGAKRE
ncbi:hypothetical protein HDU84_004908 [Entophlyctis sp. JEL0112]|nr:hypothetical protein HDU84_004908 [Entophlyctis sp. JEL0112]